MRPFIPSKFFLLLPVIPEAVALVTPLEAEQLNIRSATARPCTFDIGVEPFHEVRLDLVPAAAFELGVWRPIWCRLAPVDHARMWFENDARCHDSEQGMKLRRTNSALPVSGNATNTGQTAA